MESQLIITSDEVSEVVLVIAQPWQVLFQFLKPLALQICLPFSHEEADGIAALRIHLLIDVLKPLTQCHQDDVLAKTSGGDSLQPLMLALLRSIQLDLIDEQHDGPIGVTPTSRLVLLETKEEVDELRECICSSIITRRPVDDVTGLHGDVELELTQITSNDTKWQYCAIVLRIDEDMHRLPPPVEDRLKKECKSSSCLPILGLSHDYSVPLLYCRQQRFDGTNKCWLQAASPLCLAYLSPTIGRQLLLQFRSTVW